MTEENKKIKVKDENGNIFVFDADSEIGSGGQGKVFSTDNEKILVKISHFINDEKKVNQENAKLKRVRRSVDSNLKIALPRSILKLKNRVGYVMELMDGLELLSEQIERIHVDGNLDLSQYSNTGGMFRRLLILSQLAETLSKLHGKGLSFGDLSPGNIFVSKLTENHQAWLIDSDNISYLETYPNGKNHAFYTAGYSSPEIIRRESGNNAMTDCWSFAVIALELLAHLHPYNNGIAVIDEDPDIAEEMASKGEFPWVFDTTDDANENDGAGFPLREMINNNLFEIFQRCFGESRHLDKIYQRPTMAEWHYEIHQVLNIIIQCNEEECQSYFLKAQKKAKCPFCDNIVAKEDYVTFAFQDFQIGLTDEEKQEINGGSKLPYSSVMFLSKGQRKNLYNEPFSYFDIDRLEPWCSLEFKEEGLIIAPVSADKPVVLISSSNKNKHVLTKPELLSNDIKNNRNMILLNGNSDNNARWLFKW